VPKEARPEGSKSLTEAASNAGGWSLANTATQQMKSKAADGFMSISPDCASDQIIIGELKKLLIAILAAAGLALGADPFFFIQASDPQFGMYTANRNFVQETGNWEFAIANVNRLHPAFLVVTGDLTNKGGDPAQIAEYKRINAKLDPAIHLYSVPGNHDVENEPTPQSLQVYRASYGADYYSFREGAVYGIVLDSSLFKAPGNVSAEAAKQEAWLEQELRKSQAAGALTVIFQHIPWFLEKADEPDQYFNIPIETRRRALALLHRYGVRYVFAGHYHRNSLGREGELEMITTGPAGMPIGPDPSGLRIAEVNNGTIAHKYYGFGTLPATIPEKPSQP
jgi:3',5'-cyclic AMP phosphodiesterase CpdA